VETTEKKEGKKKQSGTGLETRIVRLRKELIAKSRDINEVRRD
jgi:hypothetical protein